MLSQTAPQIQPYGGGRRPQEQQVHSKVELRNVSLTGGELRRRPQIRMTFGFYLG